MKRKLRQITLYNGRLHQFADKIDGIGDLYRRARFLLHRRRAGKIARLPQADREQINLLLRDGLTYAAIIAKLGDSAKGLNKDNLSRWRKADHQDWLAEQNWIEAILDLPQPPPPVKDLVLLLTELDQDFAPMARCPHAFVRRVNLLACLVHAAASKIPL